MGNTSSWALVLVVEAKVPLGKLTEQEVVEVDRPDPVRRLLEADVLIVQSSAQKELPAVEPNGPAGSYEPDQVMTGIFRLGQRARILARRRLPEARGRLLSQRLVRALMVVRAAERIELPLLGRP